MSSMNNNISKLVKGGGDDIYKLQSFLALIIIGYFGIKIVLAAVFKFYPDKYYYRTVDIETSEESGLDNTKKIALSAFMPGIWNNEMTDFVTMIILCSIVYVFTQSTQRKMFERGGQVASPLIIGYLIGLSFPIFYQTFRTKCDFTISDSCSRHNTAILVLSTILLIGMYVVNSNYPGENESNYFIYMVGIILIVVGLYYTRKMRRTYLNVNYYKNKETQCISKDSGYLYSEGDQLLITPAFAAWVLLFFFTIEPTNESVKYIIYLIYGILLGVLVSSMSYYGIDYFLVKVPEKKCMTADECRLRDMKIDAPKVSMCSTGDILNIDDEYSGEISGELSGTEEVRKYKWIDLMKMVLVIGLVLMMLYFVFVAKKK